MMDRFVAADGPTVQKQGKPFTKAPHPVYMIQPYTEFEVETDSGLMLGKLGDWLCYDPISGHVWPITDEYKRQHYVESDIINPRK